MAVNPNNLPDLAAIGKSNNWQLPGINTFDNNQAAYAQSQTSTNPYWFNVAQQNLGQLAYAATPESLKAAEQSKEAINQAAQQSQNLVGQAQSSLSNITSGLANPYTASGELDTSTVAGRLFDAQNKNLQAQLPGATAGADAGAIASGGFGGLRNQVAGATARGQLVNDLAARQAQTLAENQGQAVQAATALGNLGASNVESQIRAGTYNTQAPFSALSNYADVLGSIQGGLPRTTWTAPSQYDIQGARQASGQGGYGAATRTVFAKDGGSIGMGPLRQQRMMMASGGLAHFDEGGFADRYGNEDPNAVRDFEYQYAPRSQSYVGDPEWEAVAEHGYTPDELDMKRDIARAKGYASADRDWREDDGYTNDDWDDDWQSVQDTGYTTDEVDMKRDIADAKRRILGYADGGLAYFEEGGFADQYGEVDPKAVREFKYKYAPRSQSYVDHPDWKSIMKTGLTQREVDVRKDIADAKKRILGYNQGGLAYFDEGGWTDNFKEALLARYEDDDEPRYDDDYVPEDDDREDYRDMSYDEYYDDRPSEEGPGDYGSWDAFYDDLNSVERDMPGMIEDAEEEDEGRTLWGDFKSGLSNIGDAIGEGVSEFAEDVSELPGEAVDAVKRWKEDPLGVGVPLFEEGGEVDHYADGGSLGFSDDTFIPLETDPMKMGKPSPRYNSEGKLWIPLETDPMKMGKPRVSVNDEGSLNIPIDPWSSKPTPRGIKHYGKIPTTTPEFRRRKAEKEMMKNKRPRPSGGLSGLKPWERDRIEADARIRRRPATRVNRPKPKPKRPLVHKGSSGSSHFRRRRNKNNYANTRALQEFRKRERRLR